MVKWTFPAGLEKVVLTDAGGIRVDEKPQNTGSFIEEEKAKLFHHNLRFWCQTELTIQVVFLIFDFISASPVAQLCVHAAPLTSRMTILMCMGKLLVEHGGGGENQLL